MKRKLQVIPLDPIASAKAVGLRYIQPEERGYTRKRHGKSFSYFDLEGKCIRDRRTLARIRSLVIPPAWEEVWVCTEELGHVQATGRDQKGRKQYRYHASYRSSRDHNKFGRMLIFADSLPAIRERVSRDLRLQGLPRNKVLALIVRLLDRTCIRVGNEEYRRENGSHGLTTMHDRHVDIHGDKIQFHFKGKSGQVHDIELTDATLAKMVRACRDIPGKQLFQYWTETGNHMPLHSADVNGYLREITGEDFSAKDFRTWHGSGYAAQVLAKLGPAANKSQTKKNLVAAVKETAAFLGNRPATCRKYYIHPCVAEGYSNGVLLRVMETSTAQGTLRREEWAIKALVQRYQPSPPTDSLLQRKLAA